LVSLPYYSSMASAPAFSTQQDWRQIHLGRLLGHAMRLLKVIQVCILSH